MHRKQKTESASDNSQGLCLRVFAQRNVMYDHPEKDELVYLWRCRAGGVSWTGRGSGPSGTVVLVYESTMNLPTRSLFPALPLPLIVLPILHIHISLPSTSYSSSPTQRNLRPITLVRSSTGASTGTREQLTRTSHARP